MKNVSLPAPPTASWDEKSGQEKTLLTASTAPNAQPLDAAFLGRLYKTVAWCVVFGAVLVYLSFSSHGATIAAKWTVSFVCGALIGGLLLKSQEVVVTSALHLMQQANSIGKSASKLVWLLVPLKYLLVTIVLAVTIKSGWLNVFGVALGFFTVQLIITAKIIGLVLSKRVRSVREVYIEE